MDEEREERGDKVALADLAHEVVAPLGGLEGVGRVEVVDDVLLVGLNGKALLFEKGAFLGVDFLGGIGDGAERDWID